MLQLRKIDCYAQVTLGTLIAFSLPFLFGRGLHTCLLLIGVWQVVSAILNTNTFIRAGFEKRIFHYWTFCVVDLILILLSYSKIIQIRGNGVAVILSGVTLLGAIAIAVYYWKIYFKLINLISLRDELDGLTKSKH